MGEEVAGDRPAGRAAAARSAAPAPPPARRAPARGRRARGRAGRRGSRGSTANQKGENSTWIRTFCELSSRTRESLSRPTTKARSETREEQPPRRRQLVGEAEEGEPRPEEEAPQPFRRLGLRAVLAGEDGVGPGRVALEQALEVARLQSRACTRGRSVWRRWTVACGRERLMTALVYAAPGPGFNVRPRGGARSSWRSSAAAASPPGGAAYRPSRSSTRWRRVSMRRPASMA